MKNLFKYGCSFLLAALLFSCAASSSVADQKMSPLIQSGEFSFVAERANPTGEINNVLSNLPSGGSRILNLDPGYSLDISKSELRATLPYFGRMYNASLDPSKNSYRFTSKEFTVKNRAGKSNSTIFTISTNDQPTKITFSLEVYGSGTAYLSVDSSDRQPISYTGYVQPLPVKKVTSAVAP